MNNQITILERMVLESLCLKGKNFRNIQQCTGISMSILKHIISCLIERNFITFSEHKYFLNHNINETMKKELLNENDIGIEISEITNACFAMRKQSAEFKLKKVTLNSEEEKIYQELSSNLATFIENIQQKDENIKNQKIIFWGEGQYGQIINHYINS